MESEASTTPVVSVSAGVRLGASDICPQTRLDVGAGEIVGLSGPSGCGKTTLLRLSVGDVPPGAQVIGDVVVGNVNPMALDGAALREHRRTRVAFVGQDPGAELNPVMSVRALLRELNKGADVRDALTSVGLEPSLARRRIHQLSGGQQRRVALARALVRSPQVLVLDEPFSGLDRETAENIATLLRAGADDGTGIVMTGHDGSLLEQVCDRRVHIGTVLPAAPEADTVETGPQEAGRSVLVARGLEVSSAAGRVLIQGLDVDLAPGSMTALLGASGSGKSTLLRVLQGRHPHGAGTLTLNGNLRGAGSRISRARRCEVQLVPQDPLSTLNPRLTALEAVTRAAKHHPDASTSQAAVERARTLLVNVGLEADLQQRLPGGLSGGQRQRVAIARAIAPGPHLLLCDEVTSALDHKTAVEVMETLRQLAERGTPIVVATHDEVLARRYCTHTIQL